MYMCCTSCNMDMLCLTSSRNTILITRLLLQSQRESPQFMKLSELQASAVKYMINNVAMEPPTRAEISILVVGVPWASQSHVEGVLEALSDTGIAPPSKRRRQ